MYILELTKKLLTVNKSYHCAFKNLNAQEIEGLCTHEQFLKKVHEELKSSSSESNIQSFNQSLDLIRTLNTDSRWGAKWRSLEHDVLNNRVDKINYLENLFLENTSPMQYINIWPLRKRLINRLGGEEEAFLHVNKSLYEQNGAFKVDAIQDLVKGLSIEDFSSYEEINQAVHLVAAYVKNLWLPSHFTDMLGYCAYNEKFVVLLIYPYLLLPLGETRWRTLLPVFTFVSGSFSKFLQRVSDTLNRGSSLLHKCFYKYKTLKIRKWVKAAMFTVVWKPIILNTVELICTVIIGKLTMLTIVRISLAVSTYFKFWETSLCLVYY